jgi:hypothetical protein
LEEAGAFWLGTSSPPAAVARHSDVESTPSADVAERARARERARERARPCRTMENHSSRRESFVRRMSSPPARPEVTPHPGPRSGGHEEVGRVLRTRWRRALAGAGPSTRTSSPRDGRRPPPDHRRPRDSTPPPGHNQATFHGGKSLITAIHPTHRRYFLIFSRDAHRPVRLRRHLFLNERGTCRHVMCQTSPRFLRWK